MSASFESEKNRKAFFYTIAIVIAFLLLAIFWTWIIPPPPAPIAQDLIEVNLGNLSEGFGEVQPLIKGEKSPAEEPVNEPKQTQAAAAPEPIKEQMPDDSKDADAIPVVKPTKTETKPKIVTNTTAPVAVAEPKPRKPKIVYPGGSNNTNPGNGAKEDNGFNSQGNKPGSKGDIGHPNGKPDSFGDNPGGRTGGSGLRVSKGDRTIINNYIFMGSLPKAIINAKIRVNPEGRGVFIGLDKGSTSSDSRYADAIRGYLPNIQFNKSDHTSEVVVPFNFKVQ
ncbi:SPOR domain-containing protein [Ferruginibacter profundus]